MGDFLEQLKQFSGRGSKMDCYKLSVLFFQLRLHLNNHCDDVVVAYAGFFNLDVHLPD